MNNIELNRKAFFAQHDAFVSDCARFANELQSEFPSMSRTHALKEAERIIGYNGLGATFKVGADTAAT